MSTFGIRLKLCLFGESHGEAIGCTISNVPAGIQLDLKAIQDELNRRKPGRKMTSPRKEKDLFKIICGLKDNTTLGSPITMIIENNDHRPSDYVREVFRPSHADYVVHEKYGGYHDLSGSGHFSGRLSAPLVFAGALCKQILAHHDIDIASHLLQIGDMSDTPFEESTLTKAHFLELHQQDIPLNVQSCLKKVTKIIDQAILKQDSVGACVEVAAINVPVGLGEPFFYKLDSQLAHLFFSLGGVKSVEFGAGKDFATMTGSTANDLFYFDKTVKTSTNNSGGIQAGLSNGMPIICKVTFKPTPTIGKLQKTLNHDLVSQDVALIGRHDPCIALRAFVIVESLMAFVLCDMLLLSKGDSHGTY